MSNSELQALFREISPELVVKVIDACQSGSLLIKSSGELLPLEKGGLKNLVQIASCLESQDSLTGNPLSDFTENFCAAAISKTSGPVYYVDIISILRDKYISNNDRSPHFVFQSSARETFIDDAAGLAGFRKKFNLTWATKANAQNPANTLASQSIELAGSPTLIELLRQADNKAASREDVPQLVDALFDGLKARLTDEQFSACFDLKVEEHDNYYEHSTRGFLIDILSKEKRQDNFVAATSKRVRKRRLGLPGLASSALYGLSDEDYEEVRELELNLSMKRAQICIVLTPRFLMLQQIFLVITCAPSLERCYIFEFAQKRSRTDWEKFDESGQVITRRWYKQAWRQDV